MFSIFGSKNCVGIDIGTSTLKIVHLKSSNKRFVLENYAILENKGVLNQDIDKDIINFSLLDNKVSFLLQETFKKIKIDSSVDVVISLPTYLSFTTIIELPKKMSLREISQSMEFEAKKYIPIPIKEVFLDWQVVESEKKQSVGESVLEKTKNSGEKIVENKETQEVLLVAVPIYLVEKYKELVKKAGLKLKNIELENFSLIRSILGNDKAATIIVDFGAQSTDINLIKDGVVREARTLDINGMQMTRSLSKSLGVSIERAEIIKREYGLRKEGGEQEFSKMLFPLLDGVIMEIDRMRNNFFIKRKKKIERILLSGGIFNLPGIIEYFSTKLESEVSVGNPFSRVIYPQELNKSILEVAPSLGIAVGLAMRDLI